jgi:DNA (cytosine-5)-methyltransferase 1
MTKFTPVPIIDLFAGPGGLGEGFASYRDERGRALFRIELSVEKEAIAHRTLTLRAAFRVLQGTPAEDRYYEYARGEITEAEFRRPSIVADALAHAAIEARQLELGKADESAVDASIRNVLAGKTDWVLIGGPPCQAYSLAGRSRRANDATFQTDEKHFLYREYLRIIKVHAPAVFVMENVKGLLSSRHSGAHMFTRIIEDLARPASGLEYEIRSAVVEDKGLGLSPEDYVIQAELYGVPQHRHRVILIGVRRDLQGSNSPVLVPQKPVPISAAIGDFPRIRSRLSQQDDSPDAWRRGVAAGLAQIQGWGPTGEADVRRIMESAVREGADLEDFGRNFVRYPAGLTRRLDEFSSWVVRPRMGGYVQHVARAHMQSDLARYLFASSFAQSFGMSPRLNVFPMRLLPAHKNAHWSLGDSPIPFKDRFRVHCGHEPAWTIVSHIAKDGHYYIHYDPSQCRTLTVREAARVQTFPDDYFFEGNRTQQYIQVGNAVPPLLARKLAGLVHNIIASRASDKVRRSPAAVTP